MQESGFTNCGRAGEDAKEPSGYGNCLVPGQGRVREGGGADLEEERTHEPIKGPAIAGKRKRVGSSADPPGR